MLYPDAYVLLHMDVAAQPLRQEGAPDRAAGEAGENPALSRNGIARTLARSPSTRCAVQSPWPSMEGQEVVPSVGTVLQTYSRSSCPRPRSA